MAEETTPPAAAGPKEGAAQASVKPKLVASDASAHPWVASIRAAVPDSVSAANDTVTVANSTRR